MASKTKKDILAHFNSITSASMKLGNKETYDACKANLIGLKSVKNLFTPKIYEVSLKKCKITIDIFDKKKDLNIGIQEIKKCFDYKSLSQCYSQIYKTTNIGSEFLIYAEQLMAVNKEIDTLIKLPTTLQELADVINSIKPLYEFMYHDCASLKPLREFINPNHYAIIENLCGESNDYATH